MKRHIALCAMGTLLFPAPTALAQMIPQTVQSAPSAAPALPATRADIPSGIPGYLDPTSGTFQPLPASAAGSQTFTGKLHFVFDWKFNPILVKENDDVLCEAQTQFGNLVEGNFFAHQGTRADFRFSAQSPPATLDIPFVYVSPDSDPQVQGQFICQASGGIRAPAGAAASFDNDTDDYDMVAAFGTGMKDIEILVRVLGRL